MLKRLNPFGRRGALVVLALLLALLLVVRAATEARASREVPRPPPPSAPAEALRLETVGRAALEAGDLGLARRTWEQAIEAAGEADGNPNTLHLLGILHYELGDTCRLLREGEASFAHYQAAWRIFHAIGELLGGARVVHNAGMVLDDLLDEDRMAMAHYEAAVDVFAAAGAEGRDDLAVGLNSLGTVLDTLGDYAHAWRCLEQALAMTADSPSMRLKVLNNLGRLHWRTGEHARARSSFQDALALAERLEAHALIAAIESNLGAVALRMGDLAEALDRLDRALTLREGQDDPAALGRTLSNRAAIHVQLGDLETAREEFERALALSASVGDREGMSQILGNLGLLCQDQGRLDEALEHLERSLRLEEAMEHPVGVAETIINMANVLLELERPDAAMDLYLRALDQSEILGSPVDIAKAMVNVGVVEHQRGRFEKAIGWHERALSMLKHAEAPEPVVLALQGLGDSQAASGEGAAALASLARAVGIATKTVRGLGEEEGPRAREPWSDLFDLGLRVALRYGTPEDVLYFVETGRAGSLLEALGAGEALHDALVPDRLRREEAAAIRAQHDALVALEKARHEGRLDAIGGAEVHLDVVRRNLTEVDAKIRRHAKAGIERLHPDPLGLADASALLDADEALVLLCLTSEEAAALVVRPTTARLVRLGATRAIRALCDDLAIADPRSDATATLDRLRTAIAGPLDLGDDVTRVLVSPHGRLAYVPFAALLPDRVVSYVPSATTYGALRDAAVPSAGRGRRVLALGDPDASRPIDDRAVKVWRRGHALAPLPGARREAKAIGDRVLVGADATEGALDRALLEEERWRAVHLVCHGLIDAERPMFSSLALTPEGESDGLLTVREVFGMRIPADLVTLSACETARGKVFHTEGIVGLTQAFMAAGSPRVICSLWEVDDDATRALMTRFYEIFKREDGPGAAAALKEAQAWVRSHEKWKHPYYWAAWVLWGLGT